MTEPEPLAAEAVPAAEMACSTERLAWIVIAGANVLYQQWNIRDRQTRDLLRSEWRPVPTISLSETAAEPGAVSR